ncbi:MAG TPA: glycoside hydrolase family 18 protein [Terriglobales bacterium]|jgi:chitinase|nr:glycoside hydrolase family 18 protein [Terriglobales bacterium]
MTQSYSARRSLFLAMFFAMLALLTCVPTFAQNEDEDRDRDEDHGGRHAKVLAGYFEEWSIYGAHYNIADLQNNGVADKITHFYYAFANVAPTSGAPDAACHIADSWADFQTPFLPPVNGIADTAPLFGNFAELVKLKQLHPNLKILISLGGASAANTAGFVFAASTPQLRAQLAASCIDMFIKGNVAAGVTTGTLFDGIDVDWEFPAAADKQNFTLLLKEFRKQLNALGEANDTHYLLTIAAPAGEQNFSNIELAKVARQLDFFNIEGYDYHGTWETTTNHHAPLFGSRTNPDNFFIEFTIDAYLDAGVPARKLLLGVPFYGRGWTGVPNVNHGLYQTSTGAAPSPAGDTLATNGVATFATLQAQPGFQGFFDTHRLAHWTYNATTQTFWTFDDPLTLQLKMLYVNRRVRRGLGGAFFWAFKDDDANGTLVKTMAAGLGR